MLRESGGRYELTGQLPLRSIPSTLHASLLARLDRLSSVKDIAQIGATIGGEFAYGLMAAVSELPEQGLSDALAQLVAAGLIFQRGTPPDATYRFKHTLVQDAAYDSRLRAPRQLLHGRIAGVIEERFPNVVATAPGTLAHHYAEAGIPDKAASYWTKAGRLSLERSAMVEASAQFERALRLLAELPETTTRRKHEVDLRLMLFRAIHARRDRTDDRDAEGGGRDSQGAGRRAQAGACDRPACHGAVDAGRSRRLRKLGRFRAGARPTHERSTAADLRETHACERPARARPARGRNLPASADHRDACAAGYRERAAWMGGPAQRHVAGIPRLVPHRGWTIR